MSEIPWATIVESATAAARPLLAFLPPPANIVGEIAIVLARLAVDRGCTVSECPASVREVLEPADIPSGKPGLDARTRAVARSLGLDARGIAERRGVDHDDPYESGR